MDELLKIMRALADPTRLRMALLVGHMELSVGEIALILNQSQPRVSRHIRILNEAKIIERRKEGSWVFLRPGYYSQLTTLNAILQTPSIMQSETVLSDIEALEKVRAVRAEMAETYFANHALQWDKIRSLHISESEVENAMQRILNAYDLGRVLDIGTGTGRMVELFAGQSDYIAAVDNSPEMLRVARAKLDDISSDNMIDIMLGDFNALPLDNNSFDTLILHQVLHYAQNPQRVINEAARVLSDNGRLMIVDFTPHNHEELREKHAHARLGFSDEMINDIFNVAGLHMAHSVNLPNIQEQPNNDTENSLTVSIWLGQKNQTKPSNNTKNTNNTHKISRNNLKVVR